jgi:hypothetical protein
MRIIALGASNLTRGLHAVVATARAQHGRDVEVLAALGHGRSYGADSRFIARTLPGILQCELWPTLEALPAAPTLAVVSDVGNDILYGFPPTQIVAWVADAIGRLQHHAQEIVLAGLPRVADLNVSVAKFTLMRTLLFPRCRLTLGEVSDAAAQVEDGLAALAKARGLRFVEMRREWYGVDPIHIKPSLWQPVWSEILSGGRSSRRPPQSRLEGVRLYCMRPARQRVFGVEQVTPQHGHRLPLGGRVWLF